MVELGGLCFVTARSGNIKPLIAFNLALTPPRSYFRQGGLALSTEVNQIWFEGAGSGPTI